mmetsp:Transcript_27426/g.44633  ORF Transcript_27426/g.44633 Transcript_27426/m.44633 type:complete len:426 (+) Transcript_27426:82-1359(+)
MAATGNQQDSKGGAIAALLVGSGEYTTGFVRGGHASKSDKNKGVVGLVFFDLRHRGLIGDRVLIAGTNGKKFPKVREHFKSAIGDFYDMSVKCETFPKDDVGRDTKAYLAAMDTLKKGDIVTVFTPDDTHFEIVMEAIKRGLHVMCTKPMVKTLEQHRKIVAAAKKAGVLVAIEVHKRYDFIYEDARQRIRNLGDFGHFVSYMSQPKFQLETFRAWAGKSSDISYYLNSHHIDFHVWAMQGRAKPISVLGVAATGVAKKMGIPAEDTITLTVQWLNLKSKNIGTAVYTASWVAGQADVHSQQRFFYMGHKGEVKIDQAHRGYTTAGDEKGSFASVNPLYMKYTKGADGHFGGRHGYGYRSFEAFVVEAQALNQGSRKTAELDASMPTANTTMQVTAILEAGRRSLDEKRQMTITYDENDEPCGFK